METKHGTKYRQLHIEDNLLDTILRSDNLNAAYKRVKANKCGIGCFFMLKYYTGLLAEENDMNNKRGHIIRAVLGGYLAYLGVRILMQVIENKPSDQTLMSVLAVLFIIIGGCYAGFSIRGIIRAVKSESGHDADPELDQGLSRQGGADNSDEIDPVQTGKKRTRVELQQIGPDRVMDETETDKTGAEESKDTEESGDEEESSGEKTENDKEEM